MQDFRTATVTRGSSLPVLEVNKVIRNTYALLAMTLVFSAACAFAGVVFQIAIPPMIFLLGFIGLSYVTHMLANTGLGILAVFAFTGFTGLGLGPVLTMTLHLANGPQIVFAAFGLTGAIFFALSGYALVTRKNFSYLAGFIFAGFTVAMVAVILGFFFQVPALHLGISCAFVLLSSAYILYETSELIHGGQTNYILATISLYVSIYNIFMSLLNILSLLSGRSD